MVMCSIACLRCWIEMGGDEGGGGGGGGQTSRRWEVGGGERRVRSRVMMEDNPRPGRSEIIFELCKKI